MPQLFLQDAAVTAAEPLAHLGSSRGLPTYALKGVCVELRTSAGIRPVLFDISLDINPREFVCIIGTSGAGKTTLLRVLAGLQAATTSSQVLAFGKLIDGPPEMSALLFQDYNSSLLPWRTVAGNVALGIEHRYRKEERKEIVADVLKMVGLEDRSGEYPWRLSGGMQQRVQLARALALKPSVLLMDEPFGALDAMTKAGLQDEIQRIHRETGATFVFVTHDVDEAVYLGDRIVVLSGTPGRIKDDIRVDLPRPRTQIETKEGQDYLALRHRALRALSLTE